jgi:hypothetical protein
MSTNGVILLTLPTLVVGLEDRPAISMTLPMLSIEMVGGGYVETLVLPTPVLSIYGTTSTSTISMYIPLPVLSLASGYSSFWGGIDLKIPTPLVSIDGANYGGSISMVLPGLVFSSSRPGHGLFSLSLPTPNIFIFGRVAPLTITYQGVVMNLARKAITTYSQFPFNSLAYFDGHYIGATSTGIYTLEGSIDKASIIKANLKTGVLDLGSDFIKHIRDIWLTYRSNGDLAIVLEVDEDVENPVQLLTRISDSKIHEERLVVPKGFRGRFYTIDIKNVDGSSFDLNSISLMVDSIRRKIR